MTNTNTIDSDLAQRAAYILHFNTGTKAVPCTKLTEELLRAWDRADTIAADCTERQQRLMIEEARKVIRKLYNQSQLVEVCWSTHVDAADANGVQLCAELTAIDTNEIDWDTLTIRQFRVAQARDRILDRLEQDHGARWAHKLAIASERIGMINQLQKRPQFRGCAKLHDAKVELRYASSELERVRADRDGDPRIAARALRRAIDAANVAINAARELDLAIASDRAVGPRFAGDLLVGDRFRFINDMTKPAGICELVSIAPCSYRRVVHGVGRHEWVQVDTRAQIVKL